MSSHFILCFEEVLLASSLPSIYQYIRTSLKLSPPYGCPSVILFHFIFDLHSPILSSSVSRLLVIHSNPSPSSFHLQFYTIYCCCSGLLLLLFPLQLEISTPHIQLCKSVNCFCCFLFFSICLLQFSIPRFSRPLTSFSFFVFQPNNTSAQRFFWFIALPHKHFEQFSACLFLDWKANVNGELSVFVCRNMQRQ